VVVDVQEAPDLIIEEVLIAFLPGFSLGSLPRV